jgi:hypothetical protein
MEISFFHLMENFLKKVGDSPIVLVKKKTKGNATVF